MVIIFNTRTVKTPKTAELLHQLYKESHALPVVKISIGEPSQKIISRGQSINQIKLRATTPSISNVVATCNGTQLISQKENHRKQGLKKSAAKEEKQTLSMFQGYKKFN